jgi:fatty acid-binding protein DegV
MDRFDTNLVYVNHTIQDPAFLQELLEHVRTRTGCRELIEYPASAAISTHCGPNTFGVFLLRKK